MKKIQRKECFRDLLETIFGITTFNYDNYIRSKSGRIVMGVNGLFDKNNFSLKYRKHYEKVFDITFNVDKEEFVNNNSSGECNFTRNDAINNAIIYFRRLDVMLPDYLSNSNDIALLSKFIFKIITTEILPIIFDTDEDTEKRTSYQFDDISEGFMMAINNIKYIVQFDKVIDLMYANALNKDVEFICDSNNIKEECNYFRFFSTNDFTYGASLSYNPRICFKIEYLKPDTNRAFNEDSINRILNRTEQWSDIANTFFNVNGTTILEDGVYEFEMIPPHFEGNFLPRFFCFGTTLSKNETTQVLGINSFPQGKTTSIYQFNNAIKEAAYNELCNKYHSLLEHEQDNYLNSVLSTLASILSLTKRIVLDIKSSDAQVIQSIADYNPKLKKGIDCLSKNGLGDSDIKRIMLETLLYSIDSYCNFIEKKLFRNEKRTFSWSMQFIKNRLSKTNKRFFISRIKKYADIFQILAEEKGLFERYKSNISIMELQVVISIGSKDNNNIFVPFDLIDTNPYSKLHNYLILICDLLQE
ncbi:hypothetical protein SAMN02910353_00003 [Ruminococcus sp. YRD2003]|uniref:hypothetical protein n=1 Tax=Ruminococcus sp. YRD2003 TaxID=1452313 RepID=UPI0008AB7BB0|nr:hypothetical protein SAMN02910353_00003 [Ruminococcus flavefaciens]